MKAEDVKRGMVLFQKTESRFVKIKRKRKNGGGGFYAAVEPIDSGDEAVVYASELRPLTPREKGER